MGNSFGPTGFSSGSSPRVSRSKIYDHVFFFQAEDGIRDLIVTGVQTCALPISDAGGVRTALDGIWSNPELGPVAGPRPAPSPPVSSPTVSPTMDPRVQAAWDAYQRDRKSVV